LFLVSDGTANPTAYEWEKTAEPAHIRKKKISVDVPNPSIEQIEFYLEK